MSQKAFRDPGLTDFPNSYSVPAAEYENHPGYVSIFRPRINRSNDLANKGSKDFRKDLLAIGPTNFKVRVITLGPDAYNAGSLFWSETIPSRMWAIGYLMELAFTLDGA